MTEVAPDPWQRGVHALRCPVCAAPFGPPSPQLRPSGLHCTSGHHFDRARQGYVALLSGRTRGHRSDTAPMVAARRRIQDAGIFDQVTAAVAARVSPAADVIVDAGAGTGHYLSAALGAAPAATGIACDLSKYCARAAARAHPRALSLVADLWDAIPVASGAADAVLSVFAPRNLAETARILAPGGRWLIVTPAPGHLAQVREPLGMLAIGADKLGRLHGELEAGGLTVAETVPVTATAELDAAQLADLAGMGPAGFHRTPAELAAAAQALAPGDSRVPVTVDVVLTVAAARPGHRS